MPTTRRHFLQRASLAVAATACTAPLWAAATKRNYQKAIMWDTFGMKGTVLEKFQALKVAGFHGVEASSHMNQDEVARAFDETGLKCPSVCGSRHWSKPLSAPDEKVRAEGLEALRQTVRDAKRYGATSVLLVPGVVNKDVTFEECWARSIAGIRTVLPMCEETGIKIAIENVGNNFLMKPQQAKDYLAAINHSLVGWHFDIGNMVRLGPSEEWVNVLGKQILKLHIKDYGNTPDANGKVPGFGVKLMEGSVNWPAVMSALDKVGYSGWAITEQPGSQTKDAEALKEFSARLDKTLAS